MNVPSSCLYFIFMFFLVKQGKYEVTSKGKKRAGKGRVRSKKLFGLSVREDAFCCKMASGKQTLKDSRATSTKDRRAESKS